MSTTDHAQLLRELADALDPAENIGTVARPTDPHATRARAAAAEIEGRRVPSEKEILDLAYSLKDDKGIPLVDLIGEGTRRELREGDDIEWGAIAEERFLVATCLAVLARFGGGEVGDG